jgi:hypothetical protein
MMATGGETIMTLTLEVSPELATALRDMALRAGREPDGYIVDLLENHVQRSAGTSAHLPHEEAELLSRIGEGLPTSTWTRHRELVGKCQDETLTSEEQQELIALSDTIEEWNAERLALVAELAKHRGVPFDELMKTLGLSRPEDE